MASSWQPQRLLSLHIADVDQSISMWWGGSTGRLPAHSDRASYARRQTGWPHPRTEVRSLHPRLGHDAADSMVMSSLRVVVIVRAVSNVLV